MGRRNLFKDAVVLFVAVFAVTIVLILVVAAVAEAGTGVGDVPTVDEYNVIYEDPYAEFDAMGYMWGVSSEQYVEVDTSVAPAERVLGEGLVEETFTFTEFLEKLNLQLIFRVLKFGI
jgi:hypothetical protein